MWRNIKFNISRKIENDRVIKEIRFRNNTENFHFEERVKLHSFDKLKSLAEKYKLQFLNKWGSYKLEPVSEKSSRCIILFQKKYN